MDELDSLLSPEDRAEIAAWDADAYRIVVEVAASKITEGELDDLYERIGGVVHAWAEALAGRDWDPSLYGYGSASRKQDEP